MAFIPKPQFPNVPRLPGVPQLLRNPQFPPGPPPVVGAAIAIGRLWQALFTQPLWAIYKQAEQQPTETDEGVEQLTVVADRQPVVVPDSFLAFQYREEYSTSDYQVQRGGFMSYNKVANPFETALRLSKGGSLQERKAFLNSLDEIVGTLDLYDILTPEKTYIGVNVLRYDISRQGVRGAYFFAEVDVYFREIRQVESIYSTSSADTANAQSSSARPVQNVGTVPAQNTTVTPESVGIAPEGP